MVSSRSKKVILDTSILISIFERKINIREEIFGEIGKVELIVPKSVIKELEKLSSLSKGSKRRMAKAVLTYLKDMGIEIVESESEDVDKDILGLAEKIQAIVATLDKSLIKSLKEKGIGIITWKNKRLRLI